MADFAHYCENFSPLEREAAAELLLNLTTKTYSKGEYLLKSPDVCRYLFFISEGLAKAHFYNNDKEFIMRFFGENSFFTIFDSYQAQSPSTYSVITLEPTTVILISYDRMEALCRKYHSMETFMRKLTGIATTNMLKRISGMLEEDAQIRYNKFMEENSAIVQRIALGDIARYLGIRQPSLSRIRAAR